MTDNLCDRRHKPRTITPDYAYRGITHTFICQIGKFDVYDVRGWANKTAMVYIVQAGGTRGWYVYRENEVLVMDRTSLFTYYTFTERERDAMSALLTFKGL